MPSWGIYIIILIIFLAIVSAFSSSSEIVYSTVNKLKVEKSAEANNKKAKRAQYLIENYSKLLATILIVNTLVNIAVSSAITMLLVEIWPENGASIAPIISTVYILIFGEILPKTISTKFSYKLCLFYSKALKTLTIVFKPLVFLSTKFVNLLAPLWTPKESEVVTDEELITMVDEIEEEGFIDEDTGDLVRSAIDFTDATAHEIMTPRVDVFAFNIEDDINDLINDENIFNYSRVPIYEGTIDNIIGFVNTKVLIKEKLLSKKNIDIRSLLAEPVYVFKTKALSAVLSDFKRTHTHIAIVVDEFGGTMGIITLEDIIEEIVGDIWDETDVVEEEVIKQGEDEYIIDGDMNIFDFFELVEYDDRDFVCEYTTVGGWCTDILERFPVTGDSFDFDNLKVTVLEVDSRGTRVEKVKVEVLDIDEEE